MSFYRGFRASLSKSLAALLLLALLFSAPAFSIEAADSQIFMSGFNAYQKNEYLAAIADLSSLLEKYPQTSLKDMAIFWLAKANHKAGNRQEAGKQMSRFLREYPESQLRKAVEDDLVTLTRKYEKGEPIAPEPAVAKTPSAATAPADKAAPDRVAAEKAAAEKAATEKAATEKAATEKAAAEQAAAGQAAAGQAAAGQAAAEKAASRGGEQAAAALGEPAKLLPPGAEDTSVQKAAAPSPEGAATQVLTLEVEQYADLEVKVGPVAQTQEAGTRFAVPLTIVNTGNGSDSFRLESSFPAEFGLHFAAADAPGTPITSTPALAAGDSFKAVATGAMPNGHVDGQKSSYPIRVVSSFAKETSQSTDITLVASAPLLRVMVQSDKAKLLPGEQVSYRISLLNLGTAPARDLTLRAGYPPQYQPEAGNSCGLRQEGQGTLVLGATRLEPGERRDCGITFKVKDALADQELFLRADIINAALGRKESFASAPSVVQRVSSVTATAAADRLPAIPGQVLAVPLIVTNTGNVREHFAIRTTAPADIGYTFYSDVNRDGKRQGGEPISNVVGPLSPGEDAHVIMEVATPASAKDASVASASVSFAPDDAAGRPASVTLQVAYSRPVVELGMVAKGGRLKPGQVASLELNCVNRGSNPAKQVTLQSILPAQLELVAADPPFFKEENRVYIWRFDKLDVGEKRTVRISYRVKPGVAVGTNIQFKNQLNYQDLLGNRY